MDKPNYYGILPAKVRYDKNLSGMAKLLYCEITALSNATGVCFASNKYFAELYDIEPRHVQRIIKQLKDTGYITVSITAKKREICITDRVTNMSCEGDKNVVAEGDKNVTHNNTSNNNIYNKSENTSKNEKTTLSYPPEFEAWYAKYPNKFNKQQTFKNWKTACKEHSAEELNKALDAYLSYIAKNNISEQYIVRSTNFLGRKGEYLGYLEMATEQENQITEEPSLSESDRDYLRRLEVFRSATG